MLGKRRTKIVFRDEACLDQALTQLLSHPLLGSPVAESARPKAPS
jgi:hypothetical protein